MGGFWRKVGAVGLALLPLAAVACLIAAMARDASEIAGAAAAVAGALSLIACTQLALLTLETRRVGEKQAELRAQALALARCMRVLNARTINAESGAAADATLPAAAEAMPPAAALATPRIKAETASVESVLSLPGLEGWGAILRLPASRQDSLTPWLSRRSGDAIFRDALLPILSGSDAPPGQILAIAPALLSSLPLTLATMLLAREADPDLSERLLFGVPQSALRDPDEARIVADLARAGLRLALTGVEDFRLDPEALAACSFACVEASAESLLAAAGLSSRAAVGLVALTRRFAASGVALIATGVDRPGQVARLAALGVSAASGSCLAPQADVATIPWRATPAPAAPRRLASLLCRAG